jgi:DNA-binding MarR family transcriptional regulator
VNKRSIPDDILVDTIFKIFVAFRSLTDEADEILDRRGLGRAHFRALGVIALQPGSAVSDIIATLGITNQALNRVMNELQSRSLIRAKLDTDDRRRRKLYLTDAGQAIFDKTMTAQLSVLRHAAKKCGMAGFEAYREFLSAMATYQPARQPLD